MTQTGDDATTEKNLKKYKNALRIAYEDGVIIPEEKDFLELKKKKLEITDKQHLRLEIEVLLELGRQALDRERLDESIVFINQIIERGEADLEIYELLTCLNVMGGDYEKGKESMEKCVELAAKEESGEEVPEGPVCPDCSTSIRHIEQYDRWYCDACKKYLSKDFKPGGVEEEPKVEEPKSAEPEPAPAAEEKAAEPTCPDCTGKIRHVAQYDRWYCDACKKYMAKDFKPGEKKEEPAAAPVVEEKPEPKAAEPEPEPKASAEPACPDCSGKIRHVAQYDRWYCDACKKYMAKDFKPGEKKEEPAAAPAAEPKPAEPKAEPKAAAEPACPDCSGKIRHIAQYDRYYCDACKKYMAKDFKPGEKKEAAPAAAAPAVEEKPEPKAAAEPACTDCGGKIRHIAQYDRWYCDACKKYMDKGFKPGGKKEAAPAAAAPQPEVKKDPACTDCGGKIRHIAQYDRWYCDACKKYMPTGFKA